MNRLRCFLFAAIVVLSTATFALGGVIQGPARSDQPPPALATASVSTSATLTQPASPEQIQTVLPDATAMLMDILLTIF